MSKTRANAEVIAGEINRRIRRDAEPACRDCEVSTVRRLPEPIYGINWTIDFASIAAAQCKPTIALIVEGVQKQYDLA